ncbi:hypothetical protein AX17_003158 [Amanita inopinata Kibby_2008]|nr:hypothetical protein AX17_003158 [Amanita inopinata Kibby_2008]
MEPDDQVGRNLTYPSRISNHEPAIEQQPPTFHLSPPVESYPSADLSGHAYSYRSHEIPPQRIISSTSVDYYELGNLTSSRSPLPPRYSEPSQRGVMHATSYGSVYDPRSSYSVEQFNLPDQFPRPGGQFDGESGAHGTFRNHVSPHGMLPFSDLATQTDANTLRNHDTDIFGPFPSHTNELAHTYMSDVTFGGHDQRVISTENGHFVYAPAANDAYLQTSSVSNAVGPVASNTPAHQQMERCSDQEFSHGYMRSFSGPRSISFDQEHVYVGNTSASERNDTVMHRSSTTLADMTLHRPLVSVSQTAQHGPSRPVNLSNVTPTDDIPAVVTKKKKSKMHDCEICGKKFPRPSGLRTHMNTHNNVKPYPCTFPGCTRTFAVRSNAKRHLRTHGIVPASATPSSSGASSSAPYIVGFSPPTIVQPPEGAETHQMTRAPFTLKWMPPSLSSRTNAGKLRSVSDVEESDVDEDDNDEYDTLLKAGALIGEGNLDFQAEESSKIKRVPNMSGRSALSIPLRAVVPTSPPLPISATRYTLLNPCVPMRGTANSDCCARYEERNSFREASSHPYHPSQFRVLPGPAVVPLRSSLVV